MSKRNCHWCGREADDGPDGGMVRTPARNGRLWWSCGKCPRRTYAIPPQPADMLGGHFHILARRPCVGEKIVLPKRVPRTGAKRPSEDKLETHR